EYSLVAGKTGTALRTYKDRKGYDRSRSLASFAGYFPAAGPKVVGIVMFDEPKSSIYGGEVSAPVFKRVAVRYSSLPRNYAMLNLRSERIEPTVRGVAAVNKKTNILPISKSFENDDDYIPFDPSKLPNFVGVTIRDAMSGAKALGLAYEVFGSGVVKSQKPAPGVPIDNVKSLELVGGL
ncbi:MAG: penicillin-binding transpeptidase domain-containing protein, partial [candidate division Zixibacteria bacterium]